MWWHEMTTQICVRIKFFYVNSWMNILEDILLELYQRVLDGNLLFGAECILPPPPNIESAQGPTSLNPVLNGFE